MAAGAAPHAAGRRVRICRLPGPVPQPQAERPGANRKRRRPPFPGSRRFAERVRRALTGRA